MFRAQQPEDLLLLLTKTTFLDTISVDCLYLITERKGGGGAIGQSLPVPLISMQVEDPEILQNLHGRDL